MVTRNFDSQTKRIGICKEDVDIIISKLKKRKVTSDRVPNAEMQGIYAAIGDEIVEIFQHSWNKGVFPRIWIRPK